MIYVTTRDVAALITIGTRDPALRTPGNLPRQGAKSGLHKRKMRAETRSCEVGPAEKMKEFTMVCSGRMTMPWPLS